MAATTMMMPTELVHPALPEPGVSSQVTPIKFFTPIIIAYAWEEHRYVLTPADVNDILYAGCWTSADHYVTYMREINFGDTVIPGTTNGSLPSSLRVYTDEELARMDGNLRAGRDCEDGIEDVPVDALPMYGECGKTEAVIDIYSPLSFEPGTPPPQYDQEQPLPAEEDGEGEGSGEGPSPADVSVVIENVPNFDDDAETPLAVAEVVAENSPPVDVDLGQAPSQETEAAKGKSSRRLFADRFTKAKQKLTKKWRSLMAYKATVSQVLHRR